MTTISVKLPAPLADDLALAARRRGMSKAALIRDALEEYLWKERVGRPEAGMSAAMDFAGILVGPEDLSVNKDHLRKFGR